MPITDQMDFLIDISGYNAVNDWSAVRGANITGSSIKVTQGNYYLNPLRGGQVNGARGGGVAPGGYHFADSDLSPEVNADYFVDHASALGLFDEGSLLPMLDMEDSPGDHIFWNPGNANAFIPAWIRRVRERTGIQKVAVYANLNFFQTILRPGEWADENVFLWLALYNGDPGDTGGYNHPRLAIHQHTSDGIVPGIPNRVDRNCTVNGVRIGALTLGQPSSGGVVPPPVEAPVSGPADGFPLPGNEYFGLITGPAASHGGASPQERVWVKQIQEALQHKGYAPSDPSWADGVFEQATADAVAAWQRDYMADTTLFGQVWGDDWAVLVQGRAPAWVLPPNEYYGLLSGPAASHGGADDREKRFVAVIQKALQRKGYAPSYAGWADGIFERATADAVTAWQHDNMPGTTLFGQVWSDDWAHLLG